MLLFPAVVTPSTFQYFQGSVELILQSLNDAGRKTGKEKGVNPNADTVATALLQLDMDFEQQDAGAHPGFLVGDYWATVKRGLDAHGTETSENDTCKFSREVTLAQELKKAEYSVEETIAIIIKIREKVTLRKHIHRMARRAETLVI